MKNFLHTLDCSKPVGKAATGAEAAGPMILVLFFPAFAGMVCGVIPWEDLELATVSMPIMAPLAQFAGTPSYLVFTACQTVNGLVNLVTPHQRW